MKFNMKTYKRIFCKWGGAAFTVLILTFLFTSSLLFADDDPNKDPFYTAGDMLPIGAITERVDPFSGYLTIVQRDIHLPGNGGLDVNIIRTYNSAIWGRRDTSFPGLIALNERSPLGIGWSMHMGIVRNPYGTGSANRYLPDNPVVEMPDGSSHTLYRDINDSTRFISKEFWIYKEVGSGLWELTLTDGTVYTFVYNPFGVGTHAGYNTLDGVKVAQVTRIMDAGGRNSIWINYDYNAQSTIDRITDSTGRIIGFQYNCPDPSTGFSILRAITVDDRVFYYDVGYKDGYFFLNYVLPPLGEPWFYSYNTTNHELETIFYPTGGTISYTYNDIYFDTGATNVKFSVVTERTTGGSIDNLGTWTYQYNSGDSSGDTTTITGSDGITEIHKFYGWGFCPISGYCGNVWRLGLPVSKEIYQDGSLILSESYTWTQGTQISYDDIANANWSGTGGFVYDNDIYVSFLSSKSITRDGKTYTTNYSNYDSYGNSGSVSESGDESRTISISYWYNTTKNIVQNKPSLETISGSFPGTFTTNYSYVNDTGKLNQINKYGITTDYVYDINENLYSETDANGNTVYYEWSKGRISKIITPKYTINRQINNDGTIASETNGRNYTTYFEYDNNLRLKKITLPTGNPTYYIYATDNSYKFEFRGGYYIYYFFDGFGRSSGTWDSKGVDTYITYKASGSKDYFTSNIGDTVYYDYFDRVIGVVHQDGSYISSSYSGSDVIMRNETNDLTTSIYNAFGDPDEKSLVAVTDPASNTTSYGRNILGSLTSITQGSITRSFSYNSKNFLMSETHPETETINYTRDNVGNMTSRTDSSGTRNYSYDGVNRLTGISSGSNSIIFGYDGANNRTSITSPSASITYTYDPANRLTGKSETISGRTYTTTYGYDGNDNMTDIYYPSGRHIVYAYNSNNEITSVTGFGGSVTSFNYNTAGLPTSFNYSNGKSTTINYSPRYFTTRITSSGAIDLGYSYDLRGNTETITNYLDIIRSQSFSYDSLDRLTSFSGAWRTGSFNYDLSGNRLSKSVAGLATSYSYSSNRLSSTSGGEPATFSYQGNGNLSQLQKSGSTYNLTYDGFGNLTEFASAGNPLAEFEYDGDGMRIKKTTSGKTILYHYDQGGRVISENDENNNLIGDYVYANGKLIAKVVNTDLILPGVPDSLTAAAISTTRINLSWNDNSDNETGFYIERKTGAGGAYAQIAAVGVNSTSFSDTGLNPDTTYYYRVRAYNLGGESNYSSEVYATTFSLLPVNAPSGLTATAVSTNQIDLSWTDNSNNEDGFYIERKTGVGGTYTQIASVGIGVTNYSDTGLTPGTTYYYTVKAYNLVGESAYSSEVYATTFSLLPVNAPSGLTATAVSTNQIDLSWTDNSNNEDGFYIERKTGVGGTYAQIDTIGANVTIYSDTGLTTETIYYYRIKAYNIAGNSNYSNEVYATTFASVPWTIQPIDYIGQESGLTSIAIDSFNNPHISYFYYDFNNYKLNLKYARWTGSSWDIKTVGNVISVGGSISLVLDSSDNPHISYSDGSTGELKYAKWTGTSWDIQIVVVNSSNFYSSLALDSSDNPHISYYDNDNYTGFLKLKYAKWTGSSWDIQTIDIVGGVGWDPSAYSSLALDSSNNPHILYYDDNIGDLKYAKLVGHFWDIQSVDSRLFVGISISLVLDSSDNPHISYYNQDTSELIYAKGTGAFWEYQTIDNVVSYNSLVLDSSDNPHISYYNNNTSELKYAKWTGAFWDIQSVEGELYIASRSSISLALDSSDSSHISYVDSGNGVLKYAMLQLLDTDNDNDGMPDSFEIQYGLDPYNPADAGYDNDEDGLTNLQEYQLETNPLNPDTDGDGRGDASDSCPLSPPVRNARTSDYYSTLQDAYDNQATADRDTIQSQATNFTENLNINRPISVTLNGGYDCGYTTQTGKTTLNGTMTIYNGTVTIENFILQ